MNLAPSDRCEVARELLLVSGAVGPVARECMLVDFRGDAVLVSSEDVKWDRSGEVRFEEFVLFAAERVPGFQELVEFLLSLLDAVVELRVEVLPHVFDLGGVSWMRR